MINSLTFHGINQLKKMVKYLKYKKNYQTYNNNLYI
jgi:hypothetical protein